MIHCCAAIGVGALIGVAIALGGGYLLLMYGGDTVVAF